MITRTFFVTGLAVALILIGYVPANAADDEFDLRGPASVKGQVISYSSKIIYKNGVRTEKVGNQVSEERVTQTTTKEKETEVLAVENGVATRLRIRIVKDVTEIAIPKGKRTVRANRPNRLDGQVAFGELVKGEWKYSLDDATPTPEQKRALKEYQPFRSEDDLLPKEKVKIGHEWKLTTENFQKMLGNQMTDLKAAGNAKFVRIDKDGDDNIALVEFDFDLSGKSEEDGMKLETKLSGKQQMFRSLKTGYDIKGTGTGKISVKGAGEMDGEKVEFQYSADIVDEESSKVRPSR